MLLVASRKQERDGRFLRQVAKRWQRGQGVAWFGRIAFGELLPARARAEPLSNKASIFTRWDDLGMLAVSPFARRRAGLAATSLTSELFDASKQSCSNAAAYASS
jgi:hypothetical protein